jgi:hypothetical protein
MKLQADGGGVQPSCLRVRLANYVKSRTAKVVGVLFEVRCGDCCWYGTGEVLEALLQGVGQDHPLVLAGERMREVREALNLVVNVLSLAREELMNELL